jgi:predicted acetyltransferase
MFARSSAWWQTRTLIDPPWRRGAGGDLQCAVIESEGRPTAYALYRMNWAFERGLQSGSVAVIEAIGQSPESTRAIWRYLLDIDWMARVRASLLPLDHPLLFLLAEPRRLGFSLRDGVWVRLLDVKAALSARSYRPLGCVIIEVIDEFGSVYLGGFTWTQLARALRVQELSPSAAAQADALFQTSTAPWCPEIF